MGSAGRRLPLMAVKRESGRIWSRNCRPVSAVYTARKSPPDQQLVGVIVVRGGSRRMEPDQAAVVSEEAGVVNEVGAAETAGGVEQQAEAEAVVFRVAAEGGEAEEDAPMGAPLPSERRSEPLEVVSAAARIRTPGRRHNIMLG